MSSGNTYSQGTPVHDFQTWLQDKMKWIEDKNFQYKNLLYGAKFVLEMQKQLQKMDSVRIIGQKAYDLSDKIYQNSLKVESLKNFGINDAAYILEKVVKMPLDPSHYLIRAKGAKYNKFINALSYNPGANVDANSKEIYSFISKYDKIEGAGNGENQIGVFDDIMQDFFLCDDWRKEVKDRNARKLSEKRFRIQEDIDRLKKELVLLQTPGKISMDEYERAQRESEMTKELIDLINELDKENEKLLNEIINQTKRKANYALIVKKDKRWSTHINGLRRSKNIGDMSLRKLNIKTSPISKIVYTYKQQ